MKTRIYKLSETQVSEEDIDALGSILKNGGLVAFPTETVYGLGGNALDPMAAKKIYAAKGRPSDNPLIVHIASVQDLEVLARDVPEKAYALAEAFWPGPLTMILDKKEGVPAETTGGLSTVAIRMPNHKVALELISKSGIYLAGPSANTSGRPSPTTAEHVAEDLRGKIDAIIDSGKVGIGIESTIVDLTGETPTILRPGYITKEMLQRVIGKVEIDEAILEENKDKNFTPKAPGMKYKHYAPKGELTLVEGDEDSVIDTINLLASEKVSDGFKVGIIATDETKASYAFGTVKSIGTRSDEDGIAANLYEILRKMDEISVDFIYSESFFEGHLGQAIMNRMLKAAGHRVLKC